MCEALPKSHLERDLVSHGSRATRPKCALGQWMIPLARICTLVIAALSASQLASGDPRQANSATSTCGDVYRWFPGVQWVEAYPGARLESFDALMTCGNSTATIRANVPFLSEVRWSKRDSTYWGLILSNHVVVLVPERVKSPALFAEVVKTTGRVMLSRDRTAIEQSGLSAMVMHNVREGERSDQAFAADLKSMVWQHLTAADVLGPWDLVWTGATGRVEVEITVAGSEYVADDASDVRTPDGALTARKRFFENSVLVMHPDHYRAAYVVKVLGEVFVSRDHPKVRAFVARHGVLSAAFGPPVDQPLEQRIERLRKPQLE